MRGRPRTHPVASRECNATPAPEVSQADIAELREYSGALADLRRIIERHPAPHSSHLAWKWTHIAGIAAELEIEMRPMLQRAGVVR